MKIYFKRISGKRIKETFIGESVMSLDNDEHYDFFVKGPVKEVLRCWARIRFLRTYHPLYEIDSNNRLWSLVYFKEES